MSWPERRVSELCEFAVDCVNKTAPTVDYETPYEMIRTTNVKGGFIYLDQVRHATQDVYEKWTRRSIPRFGDVILTREAPVGEVGRCTFTDRNIFLGQRLFQYRPKPEVLNWNYLAYALQSWNVQGRLRGMSFGATVHHIKVGDAENLTIPCPPIGVQERIGSALAAYDDLIENNRRRIALLEEAARLLYREWFVHFRFPGHEHATFVDGLPEGWEGLPVSRFVEVFRGKSYTSSELVETGGQPFINLKCFERGGGFRVSGLKWFHGEHKDHHEVEPGDIVIAVTDMTRNAMIVAQAARVPKTVGHTAIFSMDLVKAVPKDGFEPSWIYGMLRFSRFSLEVREHATGATVLHLKPKHIENWLAPVPPKQLRGLFAEQFADTLNQIDNLEQQNQKLAQARDLLLPRLMNGEIAV